MSDTNIYLAPVANEHAQSHLRYTVVDGIPAETYSKHTSYDGGQVASIWGIAQGNADKYGDKISRGDIILFYGGSNDVTGTREFVYAATIAHTEPNPELSKAIRTADNSSIRKNGTDNPWPFVLFLKQGREVNIPSNRVLNEQSGWSRDFPISFTRIKPDRVDALVTEHGSVRAFIREISPSGPVVPDDEEAETVEELNEEVNDDPDLTDDEREYTESKRRARLAAFRRRVRELYEETCAICSAHRLTPAGNPEVEAAHIYPMSENGSDDPRNGLAPASSTTGR